MHHAEWLQNEAEHTLQRLEPRLQPTLDKLPPATAQAFRRRLREHFPRAFALLHGLYGQQYDFFYHLENILHTTAQAVAERPAALLALDAEREAHPTWHQAPEMIGGVCYVDRFAGTLAGLRERIPYLQELHLRYLHLMPLFDTPTTNNDGGYAVSSYRRVKPHLGTMDDLCQLATQLRRENISLTLDFIFNHTSDEHPWAQRALAGEAHYQGYYRIFPDRTLPDQYERTLREIFPEQAPGNFSYRPEIDAWVWTTFWSFQWDLNYSNPYLFDAMLGEMLFLANQGVEILRFDAVAFIWKAMGTASENLPQAHQIIQAYNALARIAAPALAFKSEAIVHPREVASYISPEECPLSYNPTLMALLWEALATRDTRLLHHSMVRRFHIPPETTWINYVRVHDDIGWTFADEDAAELGIHADDHRQFLNQFYSGRFPGSHASGLPFGYNPTNQDMRISGTAASLAGLERALAEDHPEHLEHSLKRLLLLHSVILSIGGIPLLYLGDEIATLNDYSYQNDPDIAADSRWVHRPVFDWQRAAQRHDPASVPGWLFTRLQRLTQIRRTNAVFHGNTHATRFIQTHQPHLFAYSREEQVLILSNFSEHPQTLHTAYLAPFAGRELVDLIREEPLVLSGPFTLSAYEFRWLKLMS